MRDRSTSTTTIASASSAGEPGAENSGGQSISADGRYIAFHSASENLVNNDTNGKVDVFLHDQGTGETRRISVQGDETIDPTSSPDLCNDADILCEDDPEPLDDIEPGSAMPEEVHRALDTLPRTPKNEVLVVSANAQQAYANKEQQPGYIADCSDPNAAANCNQKGRERALAQRLVDLAIKDLGTDDGMGFVPDIVLLQEARTKDAERVAKILSQRSGSQGRFVIGASFDDPTIDRNSERVIKGESAIVYNAKTMLKLDIARVTTSYTSVEASECPAAQAMVDQAALDQDLDGEADCGKPKWKRDFLGLFAERKPQTQAELRGGQTVAVASIHFVTSSHLKDSATHESKKTEWAVQVADKLRNKFNSLDSLVIGGDFNIHRCLNKVTGEPGDYPSGGACDERTWWKTLTDEDTNKKYDDSVFEIHNPVDGRLLSQYADGDVQRFKRIDMIFGKREPVSAAFHDVTCGADPPAGVEENCGDVRNPQRYSDHRLVWMLIGGDSA